MKFTLYHMGQQEIRYPDIRCGRKNADFGQGFYLTPDREFTYRWAGKQSVVNQYELDGDGLCIHRFRRDTDWSNYIFRNRRAMDELVSDVVIGPIANDTIFETFGIISSGYLKPEEALKLLMIGPEYIQVALKTEKAAAQLKWIGAETITKLSAEQLRAEQDAYQEVFGETMAEIFDAREKE